MAYDRPDPEPKWYDEFLDPEVPLKERQQRFADAYYGLTHVDCYNWLFRLFQTVADLRHGGVEVLSEDDAVMLLGLLLSERLRGHGGQAKPMWVGTDETRISRREVEYLVYRAKELVKNPASAPRFKKHIKNKTRLKEEAIEWVIRDVWPITPDDDDDDVFVHEMAELIARYWNPRRRPSRAKQ
jgi:hypothetical protein